MFRRRTRTLIGASQNHRFVTREDSRSALALGALNPDLSQVAPLAVTSESLREFPCALPGCGKAKDDPIHEM